MRKPIAALLLLILCLCARPSSCEAGYFAQPETIDQGEQDRLLDQSLIIPDATSVPFNSETWKNDVKSRKAMLFDLYHSRQIKSVHDLEQLLGKADSASAEGQSEFKDFYYDLGLQNGHYTFLEITFNCGHPYSMSLQQRYLDVLPEVVPGWTEKNKRWDTLADEYNRRYFIVGMPVSVVDHLWWNPNQKQNDAANPESIHKCNDFEFQYTPDGTKVRRFRMLYATAQGQNCCTQWEDTDLRKDPRALSSLREYRAYGERLASTTLRHLPFKSDEWKCSIHRIFTLECLARSYPLIGMSREEINSLLGKADLDDYFGRSKKADQPPGEIEKYMTNSGPCGNAGYSIFEISFRDNKVVAYRSRHIENPLTRSNSDGGSSFYLKDED